MCVELDPCDSSKPGSGPVVLLIRPLILWLPVRVDKARPQAFVCASYITKNIQILYVREEAQTE